MINKLISLHLLLFALPVFLHAQPGTSGKIMVAVSAGLNASNQEVRLKGDNMPSLMRAGWRATIDLEKPFSRRFSLVSSFGYAQQGSKDVVLSGETEVLDYLEWSVQAIEYLPAGGSDFYLAIGPYVGYGVNGKRVSEEGVTLADDLFSREEYSRIDWGLSGNIGFKFSGGTFIQTGMKAAFNNCYQSPGLKYYNFALMATVGHTFGWKRHNKH